MAFDFRSLEPWIDQILSAPGTDLTTISAKRVRRQLLELDPSLTADFLKENKDEVDAVIARVFEKVSGGAGTEEANGTEGETQKEEDEEMDLDFNGEDNGPGKDTPLPPKKSHKKGSKNGSKNGRELSDAELARKLSSEINSRSTRTGGKSRGGSNTSKKGTRTKKSAATVDSDDDSDNEGGKKKTRKKSTTSTGAKGGFAKEFTLR